MSPVFAITYEYVHLCNSIALEDFTSKSVEGKPRASCFTFTCVSVVCFKGADSSVLINFRKKMLEMGMT